MSSSASRPTTQSVRAQRGDLAQGGLAQPGDVRSGEVRGGLVRRGLAQGELGPSLLGPGQLGPGQLGPGGEVRAGLLQAPDAEWVRRAKPVRLATWLRPRRRVVVDTAVCLGYLLFAFWLMHGLWPHPATRAIADNVNDQALIEWFLAHGVLFWTGDFSLVTDRLNAPDGVNLMSNASHILHGVIMAPVTALAGAAVSFALLIALNLAATAAGWYLLLGRGLDLQRGAAMVGGAFAGFAPGMIAQSNSHLHMSGQWLVPPIVWCVIRLTQVRTRRATIATALGLAALVCAQLMLGEEVLFLTAFGLAIFAATYAARDRPWARSVAKPFLGGMALAAGVSLAVLAYPLWVQLRGRQRIPNAPFDAVSYYADVASFGAISPLSMAGSSEAGRLATGPTEYNTFLGLPLLLLVVTLVIWLRRLPVTIPLAVTGAVVTLLSWGPQVTYDGHRVGLPGPYHLIGWIPLVSSALPTRYALTLIPLIAVLLAYALEVAVRSPGVTRRVVPVAVAFALLPTLPLPLAATDRVVVPEFVTSGAWRQCAPEGGVVVPVPLPNREDPDTMRWPAAANVAFAIPEGFFIGPYGPHGRASLGTIPRPTSELLAGVARTGAEPNIGEAEQRQAKADLDFWKADCVALAHVPHEEALRVTLERLLGPGTLVAGTWVWRVSR